MTGDGTSQQDQKPSKAFLENGTLSICPESRVPEAIDTKILLESMD